ncbi:hypothetical protein K2X83_03100 [Patescibacteria group bacterium]|nr:hypothetical protein [Patescibacteria group bacterium]
MEDKNTGDKVVLAGTLGAFLICALILVGFLFKPTYPLWDFPTSEEEAEKAYGYNPNTDSQLIKFTEGVNAWYVNEKLGFSFRLPDGFSAPDGKLQGADTHVVQLTNGKGNDLSIVARKIVAGTDEQLSEEIIRTQVARESLSAFQTASLLDGTGGYLFETDSVEWGGEGIAFWFTKDGYLFTLTTTKKDGELLDLVMKTWNFGRPIPPRPAQN